MQSLLVKMSSIFLCVQIYLEWLGALTVLGNRCFGNGFSTRKVLPKTSETDDVIHSL